MHSTKHARSIMYKYGASSCYMWTNKNKDHRTVKCYMPNSLTKLEKELNDAGYETRITFSDYMRMSGIIARVYDM